MAKVGKILLAVVQIGAIIALNVFAPGIGTAIGISAFLVTAVGSVVISLIGALLTNALFRPKSPMSEAKFNVRLEQSYRDIMAGQVLKGGTVGFAEFTPAGEFWYLIIHGDSILTSTPVYFMDNVQVTLSGNEVTTPEFMRDNKRHFRLWTHTYTESNPIPSGAAELAAAFPGKWNTLEHLLVGTTYTVIWCRAVRIEHRGEIYRWRGPLGLGEPNVAILGDWSNMYDPRDETQVLGDHSTYKPSRNAELIWAWWRTHPFGMNKPESSINWDRVAEQADICDQSVTGIESTQPRYQCAISARDDVTRGDIQQQIIMSCDGQLVFDDDGKTWMRVGAYETPTLHLSRNRDIIAMQSVETGESETQGVVVRYIEPAAGYTLQAAAAWRNPNFYNENEGNRFLTVDIPTISNHNQAMRVAKGIGMRSQPLQKIGPTTGLRGLQAMQERIVNIGYDNTFAGDYEVATPVEVDESGMFCSLGLVPVDADRWTLLAGEERTRPNGTTTEEALIVPAPVGVTVAYSNGRIEATFDDPVREDVRNQFQYIAASDLSSGRWLDMRVEMDNLFAYSDALPSSIDYLVRWRGISASGQASDWSDPPYALGPSLSVGGALQQAVYNSWVVETANGEAVVSIAADGTLTITDHTRRYPDGFGDVTVGGDTIATGLAPGVGRAIAYDDPIRAGGAVTYALYEADVDAHASLANPGRHYMGYFTVPASGSSGGGGGGIPGGGGGQYESQI